MASLTLNELLNAYANGIFPMSEDRDDPVLYWVDPDMRGVLPLDDFHIPRRLSRIVKSDKFHITVDGDFRACVEACSESRPGRLTTWINDEIVELYTGLHQNGYAHSVECWFEGKMVGGLYGVALGAAFFGESMFSTETDASKVALVHLVGRLIAGGYLLLDTQFVTEHLEQFGATEIPREEYKKSLRRVITKEADFYALQLEASGVKILQSITQTS